MDVEPGCVFCRIVVGGAEASLVHSDPQILAFLDIYPMVAGHTLVVPRRHIPDLARLPEDLAASMLGAGRRLAAAMRAALGCEGVNLYMADGEAAGQTVFHVHLHVLPRRGGDGFGIHRALHAAPPRRELQRLAGQIRDALRPN
jgi:diadenosine tetraphosphate (Ap4A) HIT family hydrolase